MLLPDHCGAGHTWPLLGNCVMELRQNPNTSTPSISIYILLICCVIAQTKTLRTILNSYDRVDNLVLFLISEELF